MKDLIAKLQMDANCALGAIWMHIDAQAARIAELEAQIAAKPADTDKLREAPDVDALHAAIMNLPCAPYPGYDDKEMRAYKYGHKDARHAAAELASSTALQAPVREVPGWKLVPLKLTQEMSRAGVKLRMSHNTSIDGVYAAMLAAAPLPAAPVQEPKP